MIDASVSLDQAQLEDDGATSAVLATVASPQLLKRELNKVSPPTGWCGCGGQREVEEVGIEESCFKSFELLLDWSYCKMGGRSIASKI